MAPELKNGGDQVICTQIKPVIKERKKHSQIAHFVI